VRCRTEKLFLRTLPEADDLVATICAGSGRRCPRSSPEAVPAVDRFTGGPEAQLGLLVDLLWRYDGSVGILQGWAVHTPYAVHPKGTW
jgi:hypothetical protein